MVTIKTGPSGDDDAYMCDAVGMLQWHAQIRYSGEDASFVQDATPAVLAARANDYVAYSSNAFKTILTSNLNDEVRAQVGILWLNIYIKISYTKAGLRWSSGSLVVNLLVAKSGVQSSRESLFFVTSQ